MNTTTARSESLPVQSPTYLVSAVKDGKFVQFERPDVTSAFATARRLRALSWRVVVEDPFAYSVPAVRVVSR